MQPPLGSFFAGVEYLYLKPYRSNLDFAIVSPNTNPDPEGSIQSDPWHTRRAFRIGAGYGLPNDGPDIGFYYTYLHDDQIGGLVQPAGGLLFATQTHRGPSSWWAGPRRRRPSRTTSSTWRWAGG